MCSQTMENTNLHVIYLPIGADVCHTPFARACICVLLHNCIHFALAPNGALQHVQTLHRGCPSSPTFSLVAWPSFQVLFVVGLLAILATSSLGRQLVFQLHCMTSCDISRGTSSHQAPKPKCYGARSSISMLRVPTVGTHSWKRIQRRDSDPNGPNDTQRIITNQKTTD